MNNENEIKTSIFTNGNLSGNFENESTLIGTISATENLQTSITTSSNLESNLSEEGNIDGRLNPGFIKVTTNKHNDLLNRDLPNQHPIEAITGLKEELLSIKTTQQNTSLSIKRIEEKINNKIRTVKAVPINMSTGDYIFLEKESE